MGLFVLCYALGVHAIQNLLQLTLLLGIVKLKFRGHISSDIRKESRRDKTTRIVIS